MKKHETLIIIVFTLLVAAAYVLLLTSLGAAYPTPIPPEKPVKLSYGSGGHPLAAQIGEAKRVLVENLKAQGCQEVQIAVWREEEEIFIEAKCLD